MHVNLSLISIILLYVLHIFFKIFLYFCYVLKNLFYKLIECVKFIYVCSTVQGALCRGFFPYDDGVRNKGGIKSISWAHPFLPPSMQCDHHCNQTVSLFIVVHTW